MAAKLLALFVIAAVAATGHALTEIILPDEFVTAPINPHRSRMLSIPISSEDTLLTCHAIYPNGGPYEIYPNYVLPGPFYFWDSGTPKTSCNIAWHSAPVSASGTYELLALVQHSADNSVSLTRQKFHLTLAFTPPRSGKDQE